MFCGNLNKVEKKWQLEWNNPSEWNNQVSVYTTYFERIQSRVNILVNDNICNSEGIYPS